ncbi:MAG: MFS transporter [Rhodospirillaceae bacterium]|nr:MFS transporter [Rhodospirillaceae bacterium]
MKDPRRLAVALVGLSAFIQLYAPQSLLPMFAAEFGVGPAVAGTLISATTLAVALTAPFAGAIADSIGRRRIIIVSVFALIVPTILIATAGSVAELVIWRFLQGLMIPPIFTVAVAYIGEEWPAGEVPSVIGVYTSGSALGGFLGRFITGIAAEHFGWRGAFLLMAAIELAGALVIARYLPAERGFVAGGGIGPSLRAMGRHLRNPRLLATFGVGFAILFGMVATFTYVNFYLAAPPFHLSPAALGAIFIVYMLGVVVTPMSGRVVTRLGRAAVAVIAVAVWSAALALTLVPFLPAIVVGLAVAAASGFIVVSLANGFLATASLQGRSAAVGLFASVYYLGGTLGGIVPAKAYAWAGWAGCVALIVAVLALMVCVAVPAWREKKPQS